MLKNNEPQEQLEFLKREEVRTMAKDVARLHQEEAKREREHIVSLREMSQRDTKIKVEEPQLFKPEGSSEPERPIPPSLIPHAKEQKPVFLRARTRSEKILIRAIVIGVLLFVLLNGVAFGYWYFTKKKAVEVTPSPQPPTSAEATAGTSPEATVGEPEPKEPIPLGETGLGETGFRPSSNPVAFETLQEKTIAIGAPDNILLLLSGSLQEEYPQGFTRILIQNKEGGAFLTAKEFLNKAAIAMPEPLLSLLKDDFMLFVYTSPARKRLGVIAELSQIAEAQNILRTWETTLEQDTKSLWEIVGQKGSAYTPFFRQSVYQNSLIRFQTFSVLDFGLVYTLFGTKLVLTTSFESLTKAVDQIMQSRQ